MLRDNRRNFQHVDTGTPIVTFLMVFLIRHLQNRDAAAIQVKLKGKQTSAVVSEPVWNPGAFVTGLVIAAAALIG
jgi:hypothetical protein